MCKPRDLVDPLFHRRRHWRLSTSYATQNFTTRSDYGDWIWPGIWRSRGRVLNGSWVRGRPGRKDGRGGSGRLRAVSDRRCASGSTSLHTGATRSGPYTVHYVARDPVAQWIERFPAEEEVGRSSRPGITFFRSDAWRLGRDGWRRGARPCFEQRLASTLDEAAGAGEKTRPVTYCGSEPGCC